VLSHEESCQAVGVCLFADQPDFFLSTTLQPADRDAGNRLAFQVDDLNLDRQSGLKGESSQVFRFSLGQHERFRVSRQPSRIVSGFEAEAYGEFRRHKTLARSIDWGALIRSPNGAVFPLFHQFPE